MRAPLSIIIPTLNAASDLPLCLNALGEGLEAGLIREVIVTDGGSGDDTLQIADTAGAEILVGAPGRGGQLMRAADIASGRWLMFLHADTWLLPGWSAAVLSHIQASERPACFRLAFRADGLAPRLVAGWANLRTRLGLPYGDQALLVTRLMYHQVGGYPDIPLMEDVALARALPRIAILPAIAETSAERYLRGGWLRNGARNLLTLFRYLAGADPEQLARSYR